MLIKGVIPVLQTPFRDDERLDPDGLIREVGFVEETGAAMLVFPGFASEWWKLSEEEICRCVGVIAGALSPRTALIANVTAQSTYLAVRQAERFASMGASALMCLPPGVWTEGREELRHFENVLAAVPLPQVLQYSASLTGANLDAARLREIHERHPNFCAVKVDFVPSGPTVSSLLEAFAGTDVTVLIGFAGLHLPDALSRGAHGLMPGAGHLHADIRVFEELRRNPRCGRRLFAQLLPLLNLEMQSIGTSIAVHKWLLRETGILRSDCVRRPGLALDEPLRKQLAEYLQETAGLLPDPVARG